MTMMNRNATTGRLRKTLTAIAVGVTVGVAFLTVIAGYSGHIDPRTSAFAALLTMAYPAVLIANLLMMLPALLVSRKLLVIPVAALLLTLPAALDYCPLNFSTARPPVLTPEQQQHSFTLLSYNAALLRPVDGCYLPDGGNPSVSYIINSGADIVALQEIEVLSPYEPWHITKAQIDSLKAIYPYMMAPYPEGVNLAILSRYPMKRIPLMLRKGFYSTGFAVEITLPDSTGLTLVNLHLQSLGLNGDDKALYTDMLKAKADRQQLSTARTRLYDKLAHAFRERAGQADDIREFVLGRPEGSNIIVTGDFNDVQGCYAINHIEDGTGLRSVYREVALGPRISYYANHFLFRIDHTLYRGSIKPLYYSIDNQFRKSDHFPTLSIFTTRRQ